MFYPNVLDGGCSGIMSKCALTSNLKLKIIKYYRIHIYLGLSLRTRGWRFSLSDLKHEPGMIPQETKGKQNHWNFLAIQFLA